MSADTSGKAAPITGAAPKLTSIELHSIDFIPESERHGTIGQQVRFWFLGNFVFLTAAVGFLGPSLGLSLLWAIVAAGAGNFLGCVFMALHASQGPRLGLPQLIQSRAQFGYTGVVAALVATGLTFVALNILNTLVVAQGLKSIYGWDFTTVAVVAAVVAVVTAIWGHDLLHKAFTWILLISAPIFIVLVFGVFAGTAGPTVASTGGFSLNAFMITFAAAASYNIAFAPFVSDFTRYMPRETPQWQIAAAVFGGAGLSGFIMMALGCWLATSLGVNDALAGLKLAGDNMMGGFGTVIVIVSVVAQVITAGMTAYSAHLTIITAIDAIRPYRPSRTGRSVVIIALAIAWTVCAIALPSDYIAAVNNILAVMLYLLVPWSGVNLVDFFIVRRGRYAIADLFSPTGTYGRWSWRGLTAYLIGFSTMIPFAVFTFYTGPLAEALGGADISWLIGLIVSSILYWVMSRGIDMTSEAEAIRRSDASIGA